MNARELAMTPLKVLPDAVSRRLKKQRRWILWRLEPAEQAGDKPRKMPYQANGKPAKSNDPSTWTTFDKAFAAYLASRQETNGGQIPFSGIGYVFAEDDGLVGIDLDDCRDPKTGELKPWGMKIVKRFATYAEVSPSGTGVKLWCRGRLPIDGTGRKSAYRDGAVEIYQRSRYFCVTGHKLDDARALVAKAQEAIDSLWARVFDKPAIEAPPKESNRLVKGGLQDRSRVVERARKYLDKMPRAVSGQSGHNATFRVACVLVQGFDLSPAEAYPLMAEYSQRCKPPWTEREIEHKLQDADKQPGPRGDLLNGQQKTPPENQATAIAELVADAELWHTPAGDAYATIALGNHREHWPVRSTAFKRWLAKAHFDATGKAANSEAISTAVNLIEAQATFDGEQHPVFVRVASKGRNIYIDLCDAAWRAIKVTRRGWSIVDNPPVRFRRSKSMLPLPEPEHGGSLDELRPFVNVANRDWPLVVAWLVAALRPSGPYPVLALFALQGAGKSNTARFLRALIDPNAAPLRAEPREVRDLMLSANHNWCVAFDNLSHLPFWFSDALCRLSTGGGYATRELYSNADEVIFDAVRPIILTSIVELAERSDLLDRCLPVTLPEIKEGQRRDEQTLTADFENARPKILGALLDVVAGAVRDLPHVQLDRHPRMADFAKWATAAERALGWKPGRFMVAYNRNRVAANKLALEASPIASKLLDHLAEAGEWQGTAADLLDAIDREFGNDYRRPPGWPKGARSMSAHLRRLAPNLQADGWLVEFRHGHERRIIIKRANGVGAFASFASPAPRTRKTPSFFGRRKNDENVD